MGQIERLQVAAYRLPTDAPETDGTFAWDATTIVIATVSCDGISGMGYAYTDVSAAFLIDGLLRPVVIGADPLEVTETWDSMIGAVRNVGRSGIAASAISALDHALWDLKGKLLRVPLADLLGGAHQRIAAYGSGGFTSYSDEQLASQLRGWVDEGFEMVKMKIGREPAADPHRMDVARDAIGEQTALFVDANGAFDRQAALAIAEDLGERAVRWYEEPVSSDDLTGLRLLRDQAPERLAIAAGEYSWGPVDAKRILEAGAVDVLQADATRCLGATGWLEIAAQCELLHVPLSAHCAPALHASLACAVRPAVHIEWFHDHVLIEQLLFDCAPTPRHGWIEPDRSRPGYGLELRPEVARRYEVWRSR